MPAALVHSGQRSEIYNERWCCEQFCMNNPDFRRAYQAYVRRLIDETGIDDLMSDDAIYNMRWLA